MVSLTDSRGIEVNGYKYDAFGNTLESVEQVHNRFRYAGEQFDTVTGQYYLRARFYNPVVGRFTQEDAYRGDGLNLYTYVQNNPIKYVDPSGYVCQQKYNLYKEFREQGMTPKQAQEQATLAMEKLKNQPNWTPDKGIYSVAYEARLPKDMYPGVSSPRHFQEANRQLHLDFQKDAAFAQQMEALYPGITKGVQPGKRGAFPRTAPTKEVTWHHNPYEEGLMQLVPRSQHGAAGPIQSIFHPGGEGGMEIWGGGR